jgi:hypothetical protein
MLGSANRVSADDLAAPPAHADDIPLHLMNQADRVHANVVNERKEDF